MQLFLFCGRIHRYPAPALVNWGLTFFSRAGVVVLGGHDPVSFQPVVAAAHEVHGGCIIFVPILFVGTHDTVMLCSNWMMAMGSTVASHVAREPEVLSAAKPLPPPALLLPPLSSLFTIVFERSATVLVGSFIWTVMLSMWVPFAFDDLLVLAASLAILFLSATVAFAISWMYL